MELLVVLIIAGALFFYFSSKSKSKTKQAIQRSVEVPLRVTVTTSNDSSRFDPPKIDSGNLEVKSANEFVLNPKSPLPLTMNVPSREIALQLKSYLDEEANWGRRMSDITYLVAQHNIACKEIDALVADMKPQYFKAIENMKMASGEWATASELDREDLLAEFEEEALEKLAYAPSRKDLIPVLLDDIPRDVTADDALLQHFKGDMETYRFFMSELGNNSKVRVVGADDYYRKRYEDLVEKGFAKRGRDIELKTILETIRLKDINAVITDLIPKPFGRKAAAVDFALGVSDIHERLSKTISFRELFQVVPPPGIDLQEVEKCYRHANAVAWLIRDTYVNGTQTLRTIQESHGMDYDYWEIEAEDCCEGCQKYNGKRTKQRPAKMPPYHVGCCCSLEGGYN